MEEKKTLSEVVKKKINYTREIPIIFPNDVYIDFRNYAKVNSGSCYWLAIRELMTKTKYLEEENYINKRISALEEKLDRLLEKLSVVEEETDDTKQTKIPSFGKKGDKDGE